MKIFTIGFTHKTAQEFFEQLRRAGVRRVVDVRLNNVSQLAGFTKKPDLPYFLRTIAGIDYVHAVILAPTAALLNAYRRAGDWVTYEAEFLLLLQQRRVEAQVTRELLDTSCLLCSESEPHHCHRRLVAEYLQRHWNDVSIEHL